MSEEEAFVDLSFLKSQHREDYWHCDLPSCAEQIPALTCRDVEGTHPHGVVEFCKHEVC